MCVYLAKSAVVPAAPSALGNDVRMACIQMGRLKRRARRQAVDRDAITMPQQPENGFMTHEQSIRCSL